ncbi:MAG: dTMP kinase [Methanobacteriota archaeon]|nr:MAG: dTMP kinase [Euryarchaeota archaeon]
MTQGRFIVIEGIDGSGKGTQAEMLCQWLLEKGYDAALTTEPTEGEIGRLLRKGLGKGAFDPVTEALLFAADRKVHTREIEDMMRAGRWVVCDRYLPSSLAYQGARGVELDWIREINRGSLDPDLLLILDIEPELALERINSRRRRTEYFERPGFLKKVRDLYLALGEGIVIDASKSAEEVHEDVKRAVSAVLRSAPQGRG